MHYISGILLLMFVSALNGEPDGLSQGYFDKLKRMNYNPSIAPAPDGGKENPIRVLATMYIIDVHKVDDFNMDYRASFYFRQSWNDSRLAYDSKDGGSQILLQNADTIWTPDVFFVQEKEGVKHDIISPNVFIRILPNGEVKYSVRLSLTFSCGMDFRRYPHDQQKCVFSIESYGRHLEQLFLDWDERHNKSVSKTEQINVLSFELTNIENSADEVQLTFGKYRALRVELTFKRKSGFFMTRLYIPFMFLVCLSWLSFAIKSQMVTLRLSLLLVVMYLMISIGSSVSSYIPPAPYTKCSDIWIAFCESLVFAAFLEFLFVSMLARSEDKVKDPELSVMIGSEEKLSPSEKNCHMKWLASRLSKTAKSSSRVDMMASIAFPVFFLFFNLFYWLI